MKTIKLVTVLSAFLFIVNTHAQKIGDILKKKTTEVINETLNKDSKKESDINIELEKKTHIKNFINGTIVFSDNFNHEMQGEFPSKWTQINGTLQNSQVTIAGKKEGVVQFITNSRIKPTFKNDYYLGDSFKIETQVFFHGKGNEAYTLNLMNNNDIYKAYQITIRGNGIVPAGSSSQYARMPNKLTFPGWRTVQLSFNKGVLKVMYEGYQLINIPTLKKSADKNITEFTHLEVSALSRSGNYGAMINYITIGHKGLPLYKKLMTEGRLVFYDILFDENSYFINPSSYPAIDKIVDMLQNNPNAKITIEGHTDANGTNAFNQTLSENRAKAVMNYLAIKGINTYRLNTVGYGEERPLDKRHTEEAYALNRRVEIVKR